MAESEPRDRRGRTISESMVTTPPQMLVLAVVRLHQQQQQGGRPQGPGSNDEKHPEEEAQDSVEFALPPLGSEDAVVTRADLLRCARKLAASSTGTISASCSGGGLAFGFEASDEWQGEDAEDIEDEDEEGEEIFSREMRGVDTDPQHAGVFFCLSSKDDEKAALGVAFGDPRASTRRRQQTRFLVLLLPTNSRSLQVCGTVRARLRRAAAAFFQETTQYDDYTALTQFYQELRERQPSVNGFLPMAVLARHFGGTDVVAISRALLLEGRVVCYSTAASAASAAVMALLAMLPPQLAHLLLQERSRGFVVQPCASLLSGEEAFADTGGFLLGTSNPLLLKREDARLDLVLDLDARHVTAHSTATSERAFAFGSKTSELADRLTRRFTDPVTPMQMLVTGQRARDNEWVLTQCHSFFKELLDDEVVACLSAENGEGGDRAVEVTSSISDLFPTSFRSMLEEIAAPVLSFGHVSDDEAPNLRSMFCADYGWSWTQAWQATDNYMIWMEQEFQQRRRASRSGSNAPLRTLKPPPQQGHATYIYANGDKYDGDFMSGKREGFGIYVERVTGNQYDGTWLADERHGKGLLISAASGGYIYDGEWVHDARCGQGHSARRGGSGTGGGESYTGKWRANRFHGRGIYVNSEGDVYDGEWLNGVRHGAGKLTIAKPGNIKPGELGGLLQYVGEWVEGKFHGMGSCQFADGSEYSGVFREGRRHGNGVFVSSSGDQYDGQWWQGLRHGQGTAFSKTSGTTREGTWKRDVEVSDGEWLITFANGDKYAGACRRGRPWGKGTCKFANGAAYTGEWVDGLREGRGVCANPDGSILEGEWQHSVFVKTVRSPSRFVDISLVSSGPPLSPSLSLSKLEVPDAAAEALPHPISGSNRHVYPNGDVYEGEFKLGLRDGFGVFTERATGNSYEGQWIQNVRHGNGVLTSGVKDFIYDGAWENDERCGYGHCVISGGRETYSGQWQANAFHGLGVYTDAEGSIYDGEFVRGKKHGVGKLLSPLPGGQTQSLDQQHAERYSGEWREGNREGLGDETFADGSQYSGQWKDDLQEGEGTFTSVQGDRYVGQWHLGHREGAGVLTVVSSGVTKEGQWCGDEPVDGEWTITFSDGSKFMGECVGGRPHGRGLCKYASGDLYDGMWVDGKRQGTGSGFFTNGESFVGQWENNHIALSGQGKLTLADGTEHVYAN